MQLVEGVGPRVEDGATVVGQLVGALGPARQVVTPAGAHEAVGLERPEEAVEVAEVDPLVGHEAGRASRRGRSRGSRRRGAAAAAPVPRTVRPAPVPPSAGHPTSDTASRTCRASPVPPPPSPSVVLVTMHVVEHTHADITLLATSCAAWLSLYSVSYTVCNTVAGSDPPAAAGDRCRQVTRREAAGPDSCRWLPGAG